MFSCAKFQNDPFVRSIVSSKNVKKTLLSPDLLTDDFSKILFYGDIVNNGICLCVKFHGRRPSSLWGVESQRNDMSGRIRASLALLNKKPLKKLPVQDAYTRMGSISCQCFDNIEHINTNRSAKNAPNFFSVDRLTRCSHI